MGMGLEIFSIFLNTFFFRSLALVFQKKSDEKQRLNKVHPNAILFPAGGQRLPDHVKHISVCWMGKQVICLICIAR